jgi:hypothetical protein
MPGVVTSLTGESSRARSLLSGARFRAPLKRTISSQFGAPKGVLAPTTRTSVGQVPLKAWKMFRNAGPAVMTKRAGMMQKTMGKSIFTGAFWASSWANW